MDLELIKHGTPLDFELANLLGEPPSRFIITHADGAECPLFGTPYDSELARKNEQFVCDKLNSTAEDSWWPEIFNKRKREWIKHYNLPPESTSLDFHPRFTIKLCDTVVGYSKRPHAAFGIFEKLNERLAEWEVGREYKLFVASLRTHGGASYHGAGEDLALTICTTVVRALRDMQNEKAER